MTGNKKNNANDLIELLKEKNASLELLICSNLPENLDSEYFNTKKSINKNEEEKAENLKKE